MDQDDIHIHQSRSDCPGQEGKTWLGLYCCCSCSLARSHAALSCRPFCCTR